MFADEDRPRKKPQHEMGQDLSALSRDELDERIALLQAEIERLVAEKDRKEKTARSADAFFKL